jgi:hypothetical protein
VLSRLEQGGETTYFFFAVPGLRTEFAFDAGSIASVRAASGMVTRSGGSILVQGAEPGKGAVLQVAGKNGRSVRIVLLTEAQAEQFWRVQLGGVDTAMLSPADVFADGDGVHLRSVEPSRIEASLFAPGAVGRGWRLWQERNGKIVPRKIEFEWRNSREAATRPSIRMSARNKERPQAPEDVDFGGAAAWSLKIPALPMAGLSDIHLRIHYAGDVARLISDGRLLDDDFFNGRVWEIGLKRFLPEAFGEELEVDVLPLPRTPAIYLDARAWAQMNAEGQTAKVMGVEVLPEYEVVLPPAAKR